MKIIRTPVDSSQIASIGYDLESQSLDVEFKSWKTGQPTTVYRYSNITPKMHENLVNAESIGRFFGTEIKKYPGNFPYRKLTQEEAAQ